MSKKVVAITDCDHPSVEIEKNILEDNDIKVIDFQCKSEKEVIEHCKDVDGLIVQYAPLTENVLKELNNCKVIANYGVGYDNIDVEAATKLGIQVCNVPDYAYEEVSDHAIALMLNLVRKINLLSTQTKKGNWNFRVAQPIKRLSEHTLGIVGVGGIGKTVAKKAKALGLNVIGYSRSEKKNLDFDIVSFDELIRNSDIISLHLALNNDTHHLFNKDVFKKMKSSSILINTARGSIIKEKDLVDALKENDIGGAGLDVLEEEPGTKGNPLYEFDNVIVTPHSAFYSEETIKELKEKAATEASTYLNDQKVKYPVNKI